jgi:cell division protein FtsQ
MIRKILIATGWILAIAGFFFALGFVQKKEAETMCKEFVVFVEPDGDNMLVDEKDIRELLKSKGDSIMNEPLSSIDVHNIEKIVYMNPWVAKAEVFLSIDGRLRINVKQRTPIVRIINNRGESYYMDSKGRLMICSQDFTARVLLINGEISESYGSHHTITQEELKKDSLLAKRISLDEIYYLSDFIYKDTLWKAQIEQVYLQKNGEFEMIPKVGDHRILFGDTTDMVQKFNKLKIFYSEGLNHTGWSLYDTINLKYKNQIVCSKTN